MMAQVAQLTDNSLPQSIAKASFDYYSAIDIEGNTDRITTQESVNLDSNIWDKFFLHPYLYTPPGSPQRDECDHICPDSPVTESMVHLHTMPTSELFDCEQQMNYERFKDPVLQDCMWSGVERRPFRVRNVSLSELNMVSTSTSCIDPTTFTAYPRQHNQVEHNYSLATPEPMRVPKLYSDYNTPSTSEHSESEEDVIDVVTVDTSKAVTLTYAQPKSDYKTSNFRVRRNLQEVAQRLSAHPYNHPKCMTHITGRKPKPCESTPSICGSFSGSDSEEFGIKRSSHNVMERKRRSELRQHLHKLRDQLPLKSDRPAKVLILVRARDAIQQLELEEKRLRQERRNEAQTNARLKQRLAELQLQVNNGFLATKVM
ncbi:transcriptional regulator Myc-like [Watersipora subatra]|uniref:transcriptional regulator Myc-like n=1 Tax=Watersipora subatra TaxID=2589382 RepID=UPI00355C73F8